MSVGDAGPTGFVAQWLAGARQSEDLDLQIVELIVRELLDWYLLWHEQVYLPWKEAKIAGGVTL